MQFKIPKLKSRNIPVCSISIVTSDTSWWRKSSPFVYPNLLVNLMDCNKKEQIDKIKEDTDKDLFLLTDSGGFQVGAGTCSLDWKESLLRQIKIGASKIFSFDTPTIKKRSTTTLVNFTYMDNEEAFHVIEENLKVALKQSEFLKTNYPNEFEKFCYILHGKSMEQIDFNFTLFDKYLGSIENYSKYFPGGIVYGLKQDDLLYMTIAARHAYENFIKKGIYVHFLGMGSPFRMICLIRNKITTFDSSRALQGVRANQFVNPFNISNFIQFKSDCSQFTRNFCMCPACYNINYETLLKQKDIQKIRQALVNHNVWWYTMINIFLDALSEKEYTKMVLKNLKVSKETIRSLEFCDYADQVGFDTAYKKYKHYLKKDETKQKKIF